MTLVYIHHPKVGRSAFADPIGCGSFVGSWLGLVLCGCERLERLCWQGIHHPGGLLS